MSLGWRYFLHKNPLAKYPYTAYIYDFRFDALETRYTQLCNIPILNSFYPQREAVKNLNSIKKASIIRIRYDYTYRCVSLCIQRRTHIYIVVFSDVLLGFGFFL